MTRSILSLCLVFLAGCAALPMVEVASANQNGRVQYLVFHFTTVPFDESMRLLTQRTERPVSAHYLVPEPGDPTYPHRRLKIFKLVPEDQRAWHAGRSFWGGRRWLNGPSIGIEIVNQSRCESREPDAEVQTPEMQDCTWREFPDGQIDRVVRLTQDILERHPGIDAVDVVGHSDVAPTRRLDPGPLFPWKRLYEQGIGAWYDDDTAAAYLSRFKDDPPSLELVQRALRAYGYELDATGKLDLQTRFVVRAFQMHFRPTSFDGRIDPESTAILFALLEKYRPRALNDLLKELPGPA